jgi:hypothetical protein
MNLSRGLNQLFSHVKNVINSPASKPAEAQNPQPRKKSSIIAEGYQDSTGFHLGAIPQEKQGAPDIE